MSEPKWTPGPWFYDDFTEGIYAGRDNRIGGAEPASGPLMAASPDLYEALEEMAALMDLVYEGKYAPTSMTTDDAHAALRKARGET